jgi:hypothetical protein
MGWLDSFLHPEKGYQAGQSELEKYYQQAQQGLQPYNQHGQEAYGGLSDAMKQLLDPQALQDKWSKGYQESGAAKQNEAMASQHGLDAASSMGLMGSSPALQAIQSGTAGIGAQDKQQYMNDLMQKYMQGTGIAGNVYGQGLNAAGQMSNNAMNMGQNSAGMAYGQQNSPGNLLASILGGAGGLFGSALGGPMGGMLGEKMGWGKYQPSNSWHTGGQ